MTELDVRAVVVLVLLQVVISSSLLPTLAKRLVHTCLWQLDIEEIRAPSSHDEAFETQRSSQSLNNPVSTDFGQKW